MIDQPLFLTDDTWYYYDSTNKRFMLTDKAPPEAIESYKEFYGLLERMQKRYILI